MSDLFSSLRAKQPPPGARERVLRRVEDRLERRPAAGRWMIALAAATVATAAWAWHGRKVEHARVENAKVQVATYQGRTEPLPFATAKASAPAEVVIEVAPPLPPPAVHRERPHITETPPIEVPAPIEAPPPSDLALQVEAYRAAQAEADDAAALARYRSIKQRWPGGALETEVDLRIVQTLVRLQQMDQARAAARAFAEAHPGSPQAAEMKTFGDQ